MGNHLLGSRRRVGNRGIVLEVLMAVAFLGRPPLEVGSDLLGTLMVVGSTQAVVVVYSRDGGEYQHVAARGGGDVVRGDDDGDDQGRGLPPVPCDGLLLPCDVLG